MNQIHSVLKTYFLSYSYLGLNIKVYEMTTSASHIWKGGGAQDNSTKKIFVIINFHYITCVFINLHN